MIENLPNSFPEKHERRTRQHWMYVHELRSLLDQLEPDDWLTPNKLGNLSVGRVVDGEDRNTVAAVDFFWNWIEWFNL